MIFFFVCKLNVNVRATTKRREAYQPLRNRWNGYSFASANFASAAREPVGEMSLFTFRLETLGERGEEQVIAAYHVRSVGNEY
jgi:hypothetical protein